MRICLTSNRSRGGFTVIEIIMTLGLVTILSIVTLTQIGSGTNEEKFQQTLDHLVHLRNLLVGDPDISNDAGERTDFGYLGDIGNIPTSTEGLKALQTMPGTHVAIMQDTTALISRGWNGPYFRSTDYGPAYNQDAWGNTLVYDGDSTPKTITSYGSDGAAGGSGYAQDLTIQIPDGLIQSDIHGIVTRDGGVYPSVSFQVEVNYPNGTGNLQQDLYTISAGVSEFAVTDLANGTRSVTIWHPTKASFTSKFGPYRTSVGAPGGGDIFKQYDTTCKWWDINWGKRRKLWFKDVGVTSDITNVPILVKLDSTRIDYAEVDNNGEDLRFTDGECGAQLDHEIEVWDESGTSIVWVQVPQVDSGGGTDHIHMYYGNSGEADGQNMTGVWDNNYTEVMHLQEDPDSGGTPYRNSVNNTLEHNDYNMTVADRVAGLFHYGANMDGNNNYIVPISPGGGRHHQAMTDVSHELWVRLDAGSTDKAMILEEGGGTHGMAAFYNHADSRFYCMVNQSFTRTEVGSTSTYATDGSWYHVVCYFDNGTIAIIVNGEKNTGAAAGGGTVASHGNGPGWGTNNTSVPVSGTTDDFTGVFDEFRYSYFIRTDDYYTLTYQSESDNLITYGSEESAPN